MRSRSAAVPQRGLVYIDRGRGVCIDASFLPACAASALAGLPILLSSCCRFRLFEVSRPLAVLLILHTGRLQHCGMAHTLYGRKYLLYNTSTRVLEPSKE